MIFFEIILIKICVNIQNSYQYGNRTSNLSLINVVNENISHFKFVAELYLPVQPLLKLLDFLSCNNDMIVINAFNIKL